MANPSEAEIRHPMSVLEDAMQRCQNVLKLQHTDEADLREALCYLKYAYSDVEYGLTGVEKAECHMLRSAAINMVSQLLKPLHCFNPEHSN